MTEIIGAFTGAWALGFVLGWKVKAIYSAVYAS